MSLLTQFYSSSSGGSGSTSIGYVSGYPYQDTNLENIFSAAYNPTTGWYYIVTGLTRDDVNGYLTQGGNILASTDGENFTLGYASNLNANGYVKAYNFPLVTPSGANNDVVALGQTTNQQTGSYGALMVTLDGGSSTGPVSFTPRNVGGGAMMSSPFLASYNSNSGRYLVVGNDAATYKQTTSTDGATWSALANAGGTVPVGALTAYAARGRQTTYINIDSSTALYKSTDGGLAWTAIGGTLPVTGPLAAGAENTGNLALAKGYYSTNEGVSWQPWSAPAGVTELGSIAYSDKADKYIGWASLNLNSSVIGRMVVSTDGTGSTWVYAAAADTDLQAQLWGLTLTKNAAIGLGTDLYYIPQAAASGYASASYIAKVDVSLL